MPLTEAEEFRRLLLKTLEENDGKIPVHVDAFVLSVHEDDEDPEGVIDRS